MKKMKNKDVWKMAAHDIKVLPTWFKALQNGKNFEIRRYDRPYCKGDTLMMREWDGEYTGRIAQAKITYIVSFSDFYDGIRPGYCVIGLDEIHIE